MRLVEVGDILLNIGSVLDPLSSIMIYNKHGMKGILEWRRALVVEVKRVAGGSKVDTRI